MLKEDLLNWIHGEIEPKQQEDLLATYCYTKDIAKENAEIKFETDVLYAERMTRAFNPWPIAWITLNLKGRRQKLKIFKAEVSSQDMSSNKSLELEVKDKSLYLKLQNGTLRLIEVQLEGKNRGMAQNHLWLLN
jgi:methionyl-tRNA formyltransferase